MSVDNNPALCYCGSFILINVAAELNVYSDATDRINSAGLVIALNR